MLFPSFLMYYENNLEFCSDGVYTKKKKKKKNPQIKKENISSFSFVIQNCWYHVGTICVYLDNVKKSLFSLRNF